MCPYIEREEKQWEHLSEKFMVDGPCVYRFKVPGSHGRYYYTFDTNGRPILLNGATQALGDGFLDPFKHERLADYRVSLLVQGKNPDVETRRRQDYGTVMHTLFSKLLQKEVIPMHTVGENTFDDYVRGLNIDICQDSLTYCLTTARKELQKDIMAFLLWVQEYKVEPLAIELMVCWLKYHVGSAIDLVCTIEVEEKVTEETDEIFLRGPRKGEKKTRTVEKKVRKLCIVDFKSGKKGFYASYILQLHLYRVMLKETFGVDVDGVYNFAPKAWKKEPSYTFIQQDTKDVAKYLECAMEQGMLHFLDRPKTFRAFSGVAAVNDVEGSVQYREYNIMEELYTIYCPQFLPELYPEKTVKDENEIITEIEKQKEQIAEEVDCQCEKPMQEEQSTIIAGTPGGELEHTTKNEDGEVTHHTPDGQSITITPCAELEEKQTSFNRFKIPSLIIDPDHHYRMAVYRGASGGNILTDCAIMHGYLHIHPVPDMGYGYAENYREADDDETEFFLRVVLESGLYFDEELKLNKKSGAPIAVAETFELSEADMPEEQVAEKPKKERKPRAPRKKKDEQGEVVITEKDARGDLTSCEHGAILVKETEYIRSILAYEGMTEKGFVLSRLAVTGKDDGPYVVWRMDEPQVGHGHITDFRRATEGEIKFYLQKVGEKNEVIDEVMTTVVKEGDTIEQLADEFDEYTDEIPPTPVDDPEELESNVQEAVSLPVDLPPYYNPEKVATIIKIAQTKDGPRALKTYLNKQLGVDLASVYIFVTGEVPEINRTKLLNDLLTIDFNGIRIQREEDSKEGNMESQISQENS